MGDAIHIWKQKQHLAHKNIWKPEKAVGKKGVARHVGKRKAG